MSIGPLVPADETLNHQITDTFATVSQSDRSWTEKICATACLRDGSIQMSFGLGKYPNRGVLDAYAGVSRGKQQWTVRSSRQLAPDVDSLATGPIAYEIVKPLQAVRFSLATNDVLPISFDWIFTGALPPVLENPEQHRSRDGFRLDADVVRYHQIGTAVGWIEVDGERTEFTDSTSVSTRDHSWGVRYQVGIPVEDVRAAPTPTNVSATVIWAPILCERPDGTRYGIHLYYQHHSVEGWNRVELQGGIEHPDGQRQAFASVAVDPVIDPNNRRMSSAILDCTMSDGSKRPLTVTALGDTGFHLGAGLYFGFDGHWHGEWRGKLHIDGEMIEDCTLPDVARRLHQIRDNVVRVDDPLGGGTGIGNMQTIFAGPHPEQGLTEESSFM